MKSMKLLATILCALLFAGVAAAQQSGGPWSSAEIGGKTYDSTAGAIAGNCVALSGTFPKQTHTGAAGVDARTTTTEAIADNDRCKLVTFANSGAVAASIAQAGAGGSFNATWFSYLRNLGPGTVTLTPTTSTVNGASTLVLTTGQSAIIFSDATNYFAVTGIAPAGSSGDFQTNNGSGGLGSLSPTAATAALNAMVGDSGSGVTKGMVPGATTGGGTTEFLRKDGSWSTPAGSGGNVSGPGSSTAGDIATYADTSGTVLQDTAVNTSKIAFRGALLVLTSDQTSVSGTITWQSASYDVGSWSNIGSTPTRLTVPSGVSYVRLCGAAEYEAATHNPLITFLKNGSTFAGDGWQNISSGSASKGSSACTPAVPVSTGDYFELTVSFYLGSETINHGDHTFFSIEAVQ